MKLKMNSLIHIFHLQKTILDAEHSPKTEEEGFWWALQPITVPEYSLQDRYHFKARKLMLRLS